MGPEFGQLGLIGDIREEKIDDRYHYFTGSYTTRARGGENAPGNPKPRFKNGVYRRGKRRKINTLLYNNRKAI